MLADPSAVERMGEFPPALFELTSRLTRVLLPKFRVSHFSDLLPRAFSCFHVCICELVPIIDFSMLYMFGVLFWKLLLQISCFMFELSACAWVFTSWATGSATGLRLWALVRLHAHTRTMLFNATPSMQLCT